MSGNTIQFIYDLYYGLAGGKINQYYHFENYIHIQWISEGEIPLNTSCVQYIKSNYSNFLLLDNKEDVYNKKGKA